MTELASAALEETSAAIVLAAAEGAALSCTDVVSAAVVDATTDVAEASAAPTGTEFVSVPVRLDLLVTRFAAQVATKFAVDELVTATN